MTTGEPSKWISVPLGAILFAAGLWVTLPALAGFALLWGWQALADRLKPEPDPRVWCQIEDHDTMVHFPVEDQDECDEAGGEPSARSR